MSSEASGPAAEATTASLGLLDPDGQQTLEAALRESEDRLRLALEATGLGTWDFYPQTGALRWDARCKALFGLPADVDVDYAMFLAGVHPDDRERMNEIAKRALDPANGGAYAIEMRTIGLRDGVERWIAAQGRAYFDEAGQPIRFIGTVLDMSDRVALIERERQARTAASVLEETSRELEGEQARTQMALRHSEERYRSLIDAAAQIVWTNSAAGEMIGEQPGWSELTGQTYEQYQGYGWSNAVHPDDRTHTLELWRHAVATHSVFLCEHRVRRRDGVFRDFAVRGVPVREADGTIREWVGVHTDITERKRSEGERERLIRTLERTNQELDDFAYVASHDLKAPLRGIANLSQWIEEDLADRMTDETREQMDLLRGRVRRLEGLIDGILSYSRAGRMRHSIERVDMGALLAEVVELLAPPKSATIAIAQNMPVIEAERVPLQQVLMNLLDNALKHARREDARVLVRARDAGDRWEIAVSDNGPGLASEHHERVWGIFQRLEARDKVEGAGIGLSVVKKIVETRGGRVWIESTEGAGATFLFTWLKCPAETN